MHVTAKPGKAFGEDALPNELFRAFPTELAMIIMPVMWKAAFRLEEPIHWKGGPMVELLKAKTRPQSVECPDYRGVLVSSSTGKRWHKHMREALVPSVAAAASGTQCGGIAGRGTDVAALTVRTAFALAEHRKQCAGAFFCDVVAAFYEMWREIVIGCGGEVVNDEDVARRFAALGYSPQEMAEAIERIHGESVLERFGVRPHLREVVHEAHRCAWFSTDGLRGVSRSSRGSLPGDPLGDVMFNYTMTDVLQEVTGWALESGLASVVAAPAERSFYVQPSSQRREPRTLLDVSYVDDATFVVLARSPADLLDKLAAVAVRVHASFRRRGLRLNFGAGKSEILCVFRGKGKTQQVDRLERDGGLLVNLSGQAEPTCVLCPPLYKHLGGIVDPAGNMAPEAAYRAMTTVAAIRTAPRKLLADEALEVRTRSAMASALYCSRLFHNAAVWSFLRPQAASTVASAYGKVMRLVVRRRGPDAPRHASDANVRAAVKWPDACMRVRAARLKFLPRLFRTAPPVLMAMLDELARGGVGWPAMIVDDLRWMRDNCRRHQDLPDPADDAAAWRLGVCARPAAWKLAVSAAVTRHAVRAARAAAANAAPVPEALPFYEFPCELCDRAFQSRASLASHMYRCHGVKNEIRRFMRETHCLACLMQFHSRERLFHHLSVSQARCRGWYYARVQPLSPQEADVLDKECACIQRALVHKGLHPRRALRRAVRLCGPAPRPAVAGDDGVP